MTAPLSYFGTEAGRFSVAWPGEAVFGGGCAAQAADWAVARALRRPLVVSDAGLVAVGLPSPLLESLRAAGLAPVMFDGVDANPSTANVEAAATAWRDGRCDGLIAFGGGSVIDVCKVLLASLCSDAPLADVLRGGDALLLRPVPPFAAVPTTAGTGSESTTAALVKDADGRKHVLRSRRCQPQWIALDPLLTLSTPPGVTAAAGFDVLMHALGAATNRATNPVGEALALGALERAFRALPAVLARPGDIEARADMLMASYLAGVAMSLRGVDGIHGLCTPLESFAHAPHAHVLAVVCEPLMRFNLQALVPCYARVATACGIGAPGADAPVRAAALIDAVCALRDQARLPHTLDAIGVAPEDMPAVYEAAAVNASLRLNGRAFTAEDIVAVYAAMR